MKPWIMPLSLALLAALASACTEQPGDTKPAGSAATASRPAEGGAVDAGRGQATGDATTSGSVAAVRERGTARATVTLMATPHSDARPAGQLAANAAVDILERRGGWLRVSGAGVSGWARLHQVRVGTGAETARSGEGLAILKNVGETGRSGATGIVATTGIRGLSAEELTSAKPDPAAVTAIERYRVSAGQAQEYARAAKLKAVSVPYLPQPE